MKGRVIVVIICLCVCALIVWYSQNMVLVNTKIVESPRVITPGEITLSKPKPLRPGCIEATICRDKTSKNPRSYVYKRTNFDKLVDTPVNFSVVIRHRENVVPRIVHGLYFYSKGYNLSFYQLISILSIHKHAKPERIYIWHNQNLPGGPYWDELLKKVPTLYFVQRALPRFIRGHKIARIEHASDVMRMEALLEFGGMYFDSDTLVLRSVDPLLKFDASIGSKKEMVLGNYNLASKPWSDFVKLWHQTYRTYNGTQYIFHAMTIPACIAHVHPSIVNVEPRMRAPGGKEGDRLFVNGEVLDWHQTIALHLFTRNIRTSQKITNLEKLKKSDTTGGSAMRYIYYGKPDLIED